MLSEVGADDEKGELRHLGGGRWEEVVGLSARCVVIIVGPGRRTRGSKWTYVIV
jgi:hypothetical protein